MKVYSNISKTLFFIFLFSASFSCRSQEQLSYEYPIPFNPETYVCYRAAGEINIDGKGDETDWNNAPWTNSFVDIEGDLKPAPTWDTKAKMLWDETYFYVYAKMEEPHVWATLKNRDDIIFLDDDFEVFIDPDGDSHHYYELELNALNTLWDLFMMWPYRLKKGPNNLFHWNISGIITATHIEGTLNNPADEDEYWSVEMAIPWEALKEMAPRSERPKDGDQWRINFSRVDWTMERKNKVYKKVLGADSKPLPADNWVWSPTGRINMHMPETWGYVQFSDNDAGSTEVPFHTHPDEEVKWALWNLYFQQVQFYEQYKRWNDDPSLFTLPTIKACSFKPAIYVTPTMYEMTVPSCEGNGTWHINQDGRIYLKKK